MPCIFCIAVLMLIAGALTSEHLDRVEEQLGTKAEKGVRRTVDSGSVAKFEFTVRVGSKSVPVAVTVFKDHKRVRIQVLTHQLTPEEVRQLEDELAEALDARIVDRTDPTSEGEDEEHVHEQEAESEAEDADEAKVAAAERQRDEAEHDPERVAQEREPERRRP